MLLLYFQGRNSYCIDVITQKLGYLTWQEALACLSDEEMPDALRAKYCELIVGQYPRNDIIIEYKYITHTDVLPQFIAKYRIHGFRV